MSSEIIINGRFSGRLSAGVDRYASELLRSLEQTVRVITPPAGLTGLAGELWEQLQLPRQVGKAARLWSLADTGPLRAAHQVVTIHDLSMLEHPEWFDAKLRLWYRLLIPRLARRAEAILTVSEHSKRSIIRKLGVPESKVTAVPNGVDLRRFRPGDPAPVRAKYGLPERYILFLGTSEPRKNLERLLLAWSRLTEFQDIQLIIAGRPPGSALVASEPRPRRRTRFLGYVPEEDLPGLYAGALFFVMPSLFENFGLTVLEAMACGAPVITSQAGALPEVTGEAVLTVDPTSVEAITEAIRRLVLEPDRRLELSRKGLERACRFSWERSAQQIKDVLAALSPTAMVQE